MNRRIVFDDADIVSVPVKKATVLPEQKLDWRKDPNSFAYVGSPDQSTWMFPIHDKAHTRNAVARLFSPNPLSWELAGVSETGLTSIKARVAEAAKKFGIALPEIPKVPNRPELAKATFWQFFEAVGLGQSPYTVFCCGCGHDSDFEADMDKRKIKCESCGRMVTFEQFAKEQKVK